MLIQILLILFFCFAIFKSVMRWKRGELKLTQAFGWWIFWLIAGVVVVVPNSTYYFARLLGIGRGADLVVYLALALLSYLVFRQSVRMEKINRQITQLARKVALDEATKEEKK